MRTGECGKCMSLCCGDVGGVCGGWTMVWGGVTSVCVVSLDFLDTGPGICILCYADTSTQCSILLHLINICFLLCICL